MLKEGALGGFIVLLFVLWLISSIFNKHSEHTFISCISLEVETHLGKDLHCRLKIGWNSASNVSNIITDGADIQWLHRITNSSIPCKPVQRLISTKISPHLFLVVHLLVLFMTWRSDHNHFFGIDWTHSVPVVMNLCIYDFITVKNRSR